MQKAYKCKKPRNAKSLEMQKAQKCKKPTNAKSLQMQKAYICKKPTNAKSLQMQKAYKCKKPRYVLKSQKCQKKNQMHKPSNGNAKEKREQEKQRKNRNLQSNKTNVPNHAQWWCKRKSGLHSRMKLNQRIQLDENVTTADLITCSMTSC